jgi:hypothetical protein
MLTTTASAHRVTPPGGQDGSTNQECVDDATGHKAGDITYTGPLSMWPPNHKYEGATLTATAVDPEDAVNMTFTATHNQYLPDGSELNGSGNTANDITPQAGSVEGTGVASQAFQIRSERSGREQEGRVYTISGTATFTDDLTPDGSSRTITGTSCDFEFTITVPHDQGHGNKGR